MWPYIAHGYQEFSWWLLGSCTVLCSLFLIPGCINALPVTPDILKVLSYAPWHEFFITHNLGPSGEKQQTNI